MPQGHGLGRREPKTFDHVSRYGARFGLPAIVAQAERTLALPMQYIPHYDQGSEGACVGFSLSWMMSILNRHKYDARTIYREAQKIDEWPGEDYDGTSVNAGCKILRDRGHWRLQKSRWWPETRAFLGLEQGIAAYRWATNIDEIRTAIQSGIPVTFGVNWYANFDSPEYLDKEWWVGRSANLGALRGGHAIASYAVSDRREAVRWVNTWGFDYVRRWVPYRVIERLIAEHGEVVLITDR